MGLFGKKKRRNCVLLLQGQLHRGNNGPGGAKATVGVKVLGSGCAKCNALEEATRAALVELGMDITIDHVTDFTQIAAYGVMTTPALVVDGKVVSYGKVLEKDEAKVPYPKSQRGNIWDKNRKWHLSVFIILP